MVQSSSAKDSAIYGTLAFSIALGLRQSGSNKIPSGWSSGMCVALSALGSWWLLKAIGDIKVGVTRKIGVPLESNGGYKRRLGFLERWYVAHSRAGQHMGFMIGLELEATNDPSLPEIRRILQRVSKRFPWLRVKVKRDGVQGVDSRESLETSTTKGEGKGSRVGLWGDDLYVEVQDEASETDVFSLREEVLPEKMEYTDAFERVLEEEGDKEWHDEDPNAPMWRATLVRQSGTSAEKTRFSLILAFHHLIVDGIGSTAIVQAILDECGGSKEGVNNTLCCSSMLPQDALSPAMEDSMDTVPTLRHMLLPVLLDRIPSLTPYFKPPHWKGKTAHNSGNRQCQLVICPFSLDGDKLKEACQNMSITVNSLCVATLAKAIAKTVGDESEHMSAAVTSSKDATTVRFKVLVAKSERANSGLSPIDLGAYISGPQIYVTASSGESKDCQSIGASFQQNLHASLRAAAMDIGLCPFISEDWIQFCKKYETGEPNGVNDSVEISNLGKVKFKESDNWEVKDFWFANGKRGSGPAIIVQMARTGPQGENIRAVLSAFPQAVPKTMLQQIAQAWKREMKLAVES